MRNHDAIDFQAVAAEALRRADALVLLWLPRGRRDGVEWVALNPTRPDRRLGSFKVNLVTGRWADFATGDRGGDLISLAAYLAGVRQIEAARRLAEAFGLQEPRDGR